MGSSAEEALRQALEGYTQQTGAGADVSSQRNVFTQTLTAETVISKGKVANPNYAPGGYLPGGSSRAQAGAFERSQSPTIDSSDTVGGLFKSFFQTAAKSPDEFARLQQQLFLAGFYARSVSWDEIEHGTPDDATTDAFYAAMTRTARLNESDGGDRVVWDVVGDRVGGMDATFRAALLSGGRGGAGRTVSLADPLAITQALNTVSQDTVGRKATPDEQRMFISMFHALQADAQGSGGGFRVTPDVGAQSEQFMRTQQPMQAAAKDISNTMNMFLGAVGYKGN